MMVGLVSINTLNEQNIFKEVEETLIQYNLKWNLQICITTDGGKNMCEAERT